jgi:CubicO group peptidase (beta-lactamase class C family)
MMHRRSLVASLAALGGVAAFPIPALAKLATPFDLKGLVTREQVPALGVIVVTSTQIKHLEVQGRRRLGGPVPVTAKDSWGFGDHTMGVTAALFARLVESGKLGWNARLDSLTPTLTEIGPSWATATVETFLAHRSGLDDTSFITEAWLAQRLSDPRPAKAQRAELLAQVLAGEPSRKPGEFLPGRTNYMVAAALMEHVTGQAYEDLAKGEAFDWWGASDAGFGLPLGDAPLGHRRLASGGLEPVSAGSAAAAPAILNPASGAHMTLSEYGRYLQLLLSDGGGWLKPGSLSHLARPWDRSASGYGLGWRFSDDAQWAKGPTLSQDGGDAFWRASAVLAPARDLGIVAVANADSDHACRAVIEAAMKSFAQDAPVFNELKF